MLLQQLFAELSITIADPGVWTSIGVALIVAASCLLLGVWVTRSVGLLSRGAPASETLSVGLAYGLMLFAAWWATFRSVGRSAFTPVAIGFAVALGSAALRRGRRRSSPDVEEPTTVPGDVTGARSWRPRRSVLVGTMSGGLFVVAMALLYGSTLSPSPRDRVQPVENTDVAFYAVLGRDLATTGTETLCAQDESRRSDSNRRPDAYKAPALTN